MTVALWDDALSAKSRLTTAEVPASVGITVPKLKAVSSEIAIGVLIVTLAVELVEAAKADAENSVVKATADAARTFRLVICFFLGVNEIIRIVSDC